MTTEHQASDVPPAEPTEKAEHPPFRQRFLAGLRKDALVYGLFVLGVVSTAAIIVAITGISQNAANGERLERLLQCQNSYNEVNNERTRRLALATEKERQARSAVDDSFLLTVNNIDDSSATPAQRKAAFDKLKANLKLQQEAQLEGNRERARNPVPPPPRALCGGKED